MNNRMSFFCVSLAIVGTLFGTESAQQKDLFMGVSRSEIALEDTWNLSPLYSSVESWEEELEKETAKDLEALGASFRVASVLSVAQLKELLDIRFTLERQARKLYTYAHLYFDQETKNDVAKQALQKITLHCHELEQAFSWIEPKILSQPLNVLQEYAQSPLLQSYATIIERLVRLKEHTLSESEEAILAASGMATTATHKAFSAINDADFIFADVEDSQGKKHPLSQGSLQIFLKDSDRALRKNAFCGLHRKYLKYENTIAELLHGTIQQHYFEAKSRKYATCVEASLFPKDIDTKVYTNLIDTVKNSIDPLHKYVQLRKKLLHVDTLYPWDMYKPLVKESTAHYTYDEAVELILASCKPLGEEYVNELRKGLKELRWVDKLENTNKCSGAYSSGCYDSFPYILMNYKGTLRDVFTLAHEAGHSMHSFLSHKTQPFHYADYEIFVAEVASTFNEELLMLELLRRSAGNKEEQAVILNQKLEDLRATLFRQTLFAEFELFLHSQVEKGLPITPAILKEKYLELNKFYYGEELCLNDEIAIEWARIPHFYYNFYVYQYATGISAAHALVKKVTEGSLADRDAYLEFLKSGSKHFPIQLLQKAGVDMTTPAPIKATIAHFEEILHAFEALSTQIK